MRIQAALRDKPVKRDAQLTGGVTAEDRVDVCEVRQGDPTLGGFVCRATDLECFQPLVQQLEHGAIPMTNTHFDFDTLSAMGLKDLQAAYQSRRAHPLPKQDLPHPQDLRGPARAVSGRAHHGERSDLARACSP